MSLSPLRHKGHKESTRTQGIWVIVALLVTAIVATSPFWLFLLTGKSGVQPPPRRIAVLPFLGAENADNDRMLDGLAGSIASEISRYRRLETLPFQESKPFKSRQSDLGQAARELGIDFVVTGRVSHAKDNLHLKVYLASVHRPNLPFWLEDYKFPAGEPTQNLPHRIASDVVRAVSNFR
ncbi:MAG TPA: hypothetical protein VGK99_02570 [Acidobacteriota bacterium]|jgi:TolB-like protein